MQPTLSSIHLPGMHSSSSAAAASASPQMLQPARLDATSAASAVSTASNQRILETEETKRLTSLLETKTTVGHQTSALRDFIDVFTNDLLGLRYPDSLTLKGGATNFVLMGERIHYSDIDIDVKIDDSIELDQLKQDLNAWARKNNIRFKSCKLVPKQFVIITIPAEPKDLDIQFTLSSPHACTCTYNALRIEILPIIKQSCHTNDDRSTPPMLKTVDDYAIEECLSDLETRRSRSKTPKEIVEGLRSYVSLLVKGVVPKSLEDEKGFCLGLYDQYESEDFNLLQNKLLRYLNRHFEPKDQTGRIIYLLTYAEVVRRAYIPQLSKKNMSMTAEEQALSLSQQKEGILYDIAALLSLQLGCAASGFRGNMEKTDAFFRKCRLYLLYQNHLLKEEDAPVVELDKKEFNLIVIGEKKRFHLFTPKPEASYNFSIEKLYKTSCPILRPRFQRLLYFFPQPTPPSVIEPKARISPVMIEQAPAAAAASSIPSNRQEVYGLIDELGNDGMDPLVRAEKTNKMIKLLKKIGNLPKELQNILGRQIAENATHLIAENNSLLCVALYIEAMRLLSYESLNNFLHLEQLLAYLLEKLERAVEGEEEDPPSPSISRIDDTQKIIDSLLFSHKKMSAPQKESSNQCLNKLSEPLFFFTTLDVLWKKCLSLKKEDNFSLNAGIKAIIQQFISNVLKQPQSEASDCYSHLFNSFALVTQKGEPVFDSMFIEQMSPSFYFTIRAELQLLDWQRFLPFFKTFSACITAGSAPSPSSSSLTVSAAAAAASHDPHNSEGVDVETALLEGVSYLIKEIHDHEITQKILTEICTEPLLGQFPSLHKLCKKYLDFPDAYTLMDAIKELLPILTNQLESLQSTNGSYPELQTCLNFYFKLPFKMTPALVAQLHTVLVDHEESLQLALKGGISNKESSPKRPPNAAASSSVYSGDTFPTVGTPALSLEADIKQSPYSELITLHISILLHSKDYFKKALFLFKNAIRQGWLGIENFKRCYAALYRMSLQHPVECRELLASVRTMQTISESQQFSSRLIAFQTAAESFLERKDKNDLDCAMEELKGLQSFSQGNNSSMFINDYTITYSALRHLIQFFKDPDKARYLCWSQYPALILEQLLSNKKRTQLWLKQSKESNTLPQVVHDALLLLAISNDIEATQVFQRIPSEPSYPFDRNFDSHVKRAVEWLMREMQANSNNIDLTIQAGQTHLNGGKRNFKEKKYVEAKNQFIITIKIYESIRQAISTLLGQPDQPDRDKVSLQKQFDSISNLVVQAYDYAGKTFYAINSVEAFLEGIHYVGVFREQFYCSDEFLMVYEPYFNRPTFGLSDLIKFEKKDLIDASISLQLALVHYRLGNDDIALYFLEKGRTLNPNPGAQEPSVKASSSSASGSQQMGDTPILLNIDLMKGIVLMTQKISLNISQAYERASLEGTPEGPPKEFEEAMNYIHDLYMIPFDPEIPDHLQLIFSIFNRLHAALIGLHRFIKDPKNSALIPRFKTFPLSISYIMLKNLQSTVAWIGAKSNNEKNLIQTLKETIDISLKHKVSDDPTCLRLLIKFVKGLETANLNALGPQETAALVAEASASVSAGAASSANISSEITAGSKLDVSSLMQSGKSLLREGQEASNHKNYAHGITSLQRAVQDFEAARFYLKKEPQPLSKLISLVEESLANAYSLLGSCYKIVASNPIYKGVTSNPVFEYGAEILTQMYKLNPESNELICALAICLMASNAHDFQTALSYLEKGDLNDKVLVRTLAFCHFSLENWGKVIQYYESIYQIDTFDDPSVLQRLGIAHARLGHFDIGISYIDKLISTCDKPDMLNHYQQLRSSIQRMNSIRGSWVELAAKEEQASSKTS